MKPSFFLSALLAVTLLWACGGGQDKASKEIENDEPQSIQDAMKEMEKAFQEMGTSDIEPVDFRTLKDLLPDQFGGLKKENSDGQKTSAMGVKMSQAEANYTSADYNKKYDVSIVDFGTLSGTLASSMYGWLSLNIEQENDRGYEKTTTFKGYKAYEKFDSEYKEAELTMVVSNRFIVKVEGNGFSMDELKKAADDLNFSKLEKMQ
jgi:hypothetical protein